MTCEDYGVKSTVLLHTVSYLLPPFSFIAFPVGLGDHDQPGLV